MFLPSPDLRGLSARQGFASFLFSWYLDQGRRGQLLSQCRRAELAGFLQDYRGLRWLNELEAARFAQAGDTLTQCANTETEFLTRWATDRTGRGDADAVCQHRDRVPHQVG